MYIKESKTAPKTFNKINDKNLKILKEKLNSYLQSDSLNLLIALVKKYENFKSEEIIPMLQNNFEGLQPQTQRRIRELINRQNRKNKQSCNSNSSEMSTPRSNSSSNINFEVNEFKNQVMEVWDRLNFQKLFIEILHKHNVLKLLTPSTLEIDFQLLPDSCVNEIMTLKNNVASQIYLNKGDLNEINDLIEKVNAVTSVESNILHIYELLKNESSAQVETDGRLNINFNTLSKEKFNELVQLVDILHERGQKTKMREDSSSTYQDEPKVFNVENLRDLHRRFQSYFAQNCDITKITDLINKYEQTSSNSNDSLKINLKRLKNITLYHIDKFLSSVNL